MDQFIFDPYEDRQVSDPAVAAVTVGRCLARLSWHLQQGWLLAGAPDGSPVWKSHQKHFARADRVYSTIASSVFQLEIEDAAELYQEVVDASKTAEDAAFPDGCYDTIRYAMSDRRISHDPDRRAEWCREIVEGHIRPGHRQVLAAVSKRLSQKDANLLSLGECIEDGLCRRDVYEFLRPRGIWQELREDDQPTLLDQELEDLADYPVDVPACDTSESENDVDLLATLSRDPGDLAPHDMWLDRLRPELERSGLDVRRECLRGLARAIKRRKLTRKGLRERVATLHDRVCRDLAKSIGGDRLKVDVGSKPPCITLDGIPYDVEPEAAYLFHGLLEAGGSRSLTSIKAQYPCVFGKHPHLDRIVKSLPPKLRKLIDSGSGKPTRLVLS